ncbi:hypothetical protein DBR32_05970 [Taibaiella sp. KBW10]|uniref:hypothetical protein n=1 Tax=Taibaiella sp. KBW10 TaxID=2153357 RepID=UPI000F599AB8|nr:hypothetical protein [Taibaiella sp. KBW10]RQO31502.1 hypothetical protein DBR32_05970 [Taibaiella sp. KBW10]
MKKIFSFYFIAVLFLFSLTSCNRLKPAGFWYNFQSKDISYKESDHGPWGGHTAILWHSKHIGHFATETALDFAKENGWIFVDSTQVAKLIVNGWVYNEKNIFPLSYSDTFRPHVISFSATFAHFPRQINTEMTVYRFKTGWISIHAETTQAEEINGFLTMSMDKKEMAIYHKWGE